MQRDVWAATHLWRDTLHISILQLSTRAGVGGSGESSWRGVMGGSEYRFLSVSYFTKRHEQISDSKREI